MSGSGISWAICKSAPWPCQHPTIQFFYRKDSIRPWIWHTLNDSPESSIGAKSDIYDCLLPSWDTSPKKDSQCSICFFVYFSMIICIGFYSYASSVQWCTRYTFLMLLTKYTTELDVQITCCVKAEHLKLTQNTSCFSCAWHKILWTWRICCRFGESNSSTGIWWNVNSASVTKYTI